MKGKNVTSQPLAEVFGFPAHIQSAKAQRYRNSRLCPFNNRVPNCTKDRANDPLGVCSVFDAQSNIAITCPVRFRQDWLVAEDAAHFFFSKDATWTSLAEVRLNDKNGVSAGNIDIVLVSYDERGRLLDFGALEIQAVYISGNVRKPFAAYMNDTESYMANPDAGTRQRPRPDYLSSSRKRLVPQLIYKGDILRAWGKKQAVALHSGFFDSLPTLDEVDPSKAEIAWLVYDLVGDERAEQYQLTLKRTVYTRFQASLSQITTPQPGTLADFTWQLQSRLDAKLDDEQTPPDAPTLDELL